MSRRAVLLAGALALAGGWLQAQVPPEERIPIQDPNRLEALGFSRDATNVYVWSKADLGGSRATEAANLENPETWGTGVGYSTSHGYELQVSTPDRLVGKSYTDGALCYDLSGYVTGVHAFARIQAPEGASLGQLRSWSFDSDPDQDLIYRVWETCQAYGYDPPAHTLVAENSTLGAIGYLPGTKSLNGLTVNNQVCTYTVDVEFAGPDESCSSGGLRALKLQTSWTRQVSPAPATASFNDVPTSHLFFQHVEALVKSGVTAGCGGGNYCPDQPVTRGQMAVFLAKTLGLQWP